MPSAPAAGRGASPRTSSAYVPLDSLQLPSLALPVAALASRPVTNGGSSSAVSSAGVATPTRGAPSTAPNNVPPLPPTQGFTGSFTSYRGLEEAFQSQRLEIEKLTALLAGRSPQLAPPPPAELASPSGVPTPFTQARFTGSFTGADKVPSPDFEFSYL